MVKYRQRRSTDLTELNETISLEDRFIQLMTRWVRFVDATQGRARFIAAVLLLTLVGAWLDYVSGRQVILVAFYFVPVFFATSTLGFRAGLVLACICAAVTIMLRILDGTISPDDRLMLWNTMARLIIGIVCLGLLWVLQQCVRKEAARARLDMLTGIANRLAFFELAEQVLLSAQRLGTPFSLAYIDADDFKVINDSYGHDAGDRTLRVIAHVIKENVRTDVVVRLGGDVVARLGGDEFVILIAGAQPSDVDSIVQRVCARLKIATTLYETPLTFSVGVVTFLQAPATVDLAVKRADEVMYEIKKGGGDAVRQLVCKDGWETGDAVDTERGSKP